MGGHSSVSGLKSWGAKKKCIHQTSGSLNSSGLHALSPKEWVACLTKMICWTSTARVENRGRWKGWESEPWMDSGMTNGLDWKFYPTQTLGRAGGGRREGKPGQGAGTVCCSVIIFYFLPPNAKLIFFRYAKKPMARALFSKFSDKGIWERPKQWEVLSLQRLPFSAFV